MESQKRRQNNFICYLLAGDLGKYLIEVYLITQSVLVWLLCQCNDDHEPKTKDEFVLINFKVDRTYLRFVKDTVGIAVRRVGAIFVVRPKPVNPKICCWLPWFWIATTMLCVTVCSWPLRAYIYTWIIFIDSSKLMLKCWEAYVL